MRSMFEALVVSRDATVNDPAGQQVGGCADSSGGGGQCGCRRESQDNARLDSG